MLASLNHPGIAAIYGIEKSDDTQALVLELVEGPTLADRIAKGPIPLDEALPIAKQIAEALEAAHEAGVIHRDLKPANIKVRDDGTVKVLDFGLAKALDPSPETDPSQSPTLTAAATQMGVILGTAAYMSPEQARGKPVDKRADIWAFGVVLYEMLTGRRPFAGEDVSEVMAGVIKSAVEWDTLPADVPPALGTYLRQCLKKDPRERIRDIGDVRLAMLGAFDVPAQPPLELPEPAVVGAQLRLWQRPIPAATVALAIAGIASFAVWNLTRSDTPAARPVRFPITVLAPERLSLTSDSVAVSPDGRLVAYLADTTWDWSERGSKRLLLRSLGDLTPTTLTGGSQLSNPFFSADGEWVGFQDLSDLALRRISVQGGSAVPMGDLDAALRGASWGDDDTIIFATSANDTGLWRVTPSGGPPEQLTTPDGAQGEWDHAWPQILPGGRAVLFTVIADSIEDSHMAMYSLDTGEQTVVARGVFRARYVPTGHLVYGVGNTLWAVRFDLERQETMEAPVAVVDGVTTNYSLSENGSLVYVPEVIASQARTLVWVDRDGREEELPASPAPYEAPSISPDGRYIAVGVEDPENWDVMVYDLQRDTPTQLTFDPGRDRHPLWSPNGQRLVFSSDREGSMSVYSIAANGTGQAERITTSDGGGYHYPMSWAADEQTLVVGVLDNQWDLAVISPDAKTGTQGLIETEASEGIADVSPDGRWIAYQSDESGQFEVYVRPFPNVDDDRWSISRDGGISPVWAPNGQELFYRASDSGDMMVVAVETEPTFSPAQPEVLFEAPYLSFQFTRSRPWDVGQDGRFLMIKDTGEQTAADPSIVFVQNWTQELLERVPVP